MSILDILMPTYNRAAFLDKNVSQLLEYIQNLDLKNLVTIIISDNNSTDNTDKVLMKYKENKNIKIYKQNYNIGLEKNALYCLDMSRSKFVMYLGDDDYITEEYLKTVYMKITSQTDLTFIVPSFYNVNLDGKLIKNSGRDIGKLETRHEKGINSALFFSYRAHQLSGITFRRKGVIEKYRDNLVNNIYPFIYFITVSALNGSGFHVPQYPVEVTYPGQQNKDWGYGDDGLLDEIFNNFKSIKNITYIQRVHLEQNFLKYNSWRYMSSIKKNPLAFFLSVIKSRNTSFITKISYVFLVPVSIVKHLTRLNEK